MKHWAQRILAAAAFIAIAVLVIGPGIQADEARDDVRFDKNFLTQEQRIEDFEYLFGILDNHYPFFWAKERLGYASWPGREKEFRAYFEGAETPEAFYLAVKTMIDGLHNLHAGMLGRSSIEGAAGSSFYLEDPWRESALRALPASAFWDEVARGVWSDTSALRSYYLDGDYYMADGVTLADGSFIPYGSHILAINGRSPEDLVERMKERFYLVRDPTNDVVFTLNLFDAVSGDEAVEIELEDPAQRIQIVNDDIVGMQYCFNHWPISRGPTFVDLVPGKVGYVKIPSFSHLRIEQDSQALLEFFDAHQDDSVIMIDIRGNQGGSTNYWSQNILEPLLDRKQTVSMFWGVRDGDYLDPFTNAKGMGTYHELLRKGDYPPSVPPEVDDGLVDQVYEIKYDVEGRRNSQYGPKVYLLVDRMVYSASESFAAWVKASGWAVIVGEQTGGDGIGFEPVPIVLPNSLVEVQFPAALGMTSAGEVDEEARVSPDIRTTWTVEDWRGQCDALKEGMFEPYILRHHDPDVRAVLLDAGIL